MAENVMQISETELASGLASLTEGVLGRCGSSVRAALERHLRDVVVVPYDLELSRQYGKAKASFVPGTVVGAGTPFHCIIANTSIGFREEGRQCRGQFLWNGEPSRSGLLTFLRGAIPASG